MRARVLVLGAAVVGTTATVVVSIAPFVRFAYRNPSLHLVLETSESLATLLLAYLLVGRFRETAEASDAGLVLALALLGGASLLLSVIPFAVAGASRGVFSTWAPLLVKFAAPVILAVSAFLPKRRLQRVGRSPVTLAVAACGFIAAVALATLVLSPFLPLAIDPGLSPEASNRPRIIGNPVVLALQIVSAVLYGLAAAGFLRRSEHDRDDLMSWLAAGSTLAAFGQLNYFLFPSLFSQWVYTGDVLRFGFYLLLLVGAAREIGCYWRVRGEVAVLDERRRMASNLHDGLAQELAFIAGHAHRLTRVDSNREDAELIEAAAVRALDESRSAIQMLTLPRNEPLDVALAAAAAEVGERMGVEVQLDVARGIDVPEAVSEALQRIVREAVTNSGRHGGARLVRLALSRDDGLTLRVRDDGVGFDASTAGENGGFGVSSMRERAEALGGSFNLSSEPGRGTEVQVGVPWPTTSAS